MHTHTHAHTRTHAHTHTHTHTHIHTHTHQPRVAVSVLTVYYHKTYLSFEVGTINSLQCITGISTTQWRRARVLTLVSLVMTVEQARPSVVAKQMGDHYVLGFAPALRFLQSQILCWLYNSASDETINWGPACVYTRMQKYHINSDNTHVKEPVVHVRVWWIMGTPKIAQHALKVSESSGCWSWTLYGRRRQWNQHFHSYIPTLALRNLGPILESMPTACATSDTSAPVTSQTADMALMLEMRWARKALAAWNKKLRLLSPEDTSTQNTHTHTEITHTHTHTHTHRTHTYTHTEHTHTYTHIQRTHIHTHTHNPCTTHNTHAHTNTHTRTHTQTHTHTHAQMHVRSCVKVKVAVLGSPSLIMAHSPYGLCGRKATVNCQATDQLGQLRGPGVGGDDLLSGHPVLVHPAQRRHRLLSLHRLLPADQHTIRVEEVRDGRALCQKLRVGQHLATTGGKFSSRCWFGRKWKTKKEAKKDEEGRKRKTKKEEKGRRRRKKKEERYKEEDKGNREEEEGEEEKKEKKRNMKNKEKMEEEDTAEDKEEQEEEKKEKRR